MAQSSIKGYVGLGFAMGVLSPIVHGLGGCALVAVLGGFLLKACVNLHCLGRALWDGRLLTETNYTPLDKRHPVAWLIGLGCVALLIAALPIKPAGVVIDVIVIGQVGFIIMHLLGRSFLLRRFKKVRIARQRQLFGL